jgi:hypothetical protein
MDNVIEREPAEAELQKIVDFFEVDPEGSAWEDSRKRLLGAIMKGRIILDDDKSALVLTLSSPITLDNSGSVAEMTFKEPTAADLKVLDKYKEGEAMAKTVHLASRMSGHPIGVVDRMGARDLQVMAAITSLFF